MKKKSGKNLNFLLTTAFSLFFAFAYSQNERVIQQLPDPDGGWLIQTRSSAYRLVVARDKKLIPVFYGPVQQADHKKRTPFWSNRVEEVPVRGGSPNKTPVLEVVYQDNVCSANLEYVSGEVLTIDGRPALKIVQKDRSYPLQITSYIRVIQEYDILEKWIELKNTGSKGEMRIQNLLSGSILLPSGRYVLTQLSGSELGEFHPYQSDLTPGLKIVENRLFKSNNHMPWFLIRPKQTANDPTGPAWWGSVHYSGNWRLVFDYAYERPSNYSLQVAGGMNFRDVEWNLSPGEVLTTPKFSIGYTNGGAEEAARNNAAYVRNTVLPLQHRKTLRPLLFNGWVNTTFFINDSIELAMAREAADLGVELFAIDDGWFKNRNSSGEGLGDWEVDRKKFPNGLQPLIDSVHKMGMQFGLWVEPESMVKKSEVYKNHPDWALEYPNRRSTPSRLFINLAREDVYQNLYKALDKILTENRIDFIKWDQNTYLSEAGWAGVDPETQKETGIRFIHNLYRLVDALRARHPNVLFESCASGGGLVDLGMLSRMDQVWTSDNSMAVDRLFIQYGYLSAMPANTMESWILGDWNNQQNGQPSLSYKFDVAMSGLPGISCNILKWTPEEKALAKKKIAIYKNIRPLVQQGNLYRLVSPFDNNRCALQYNSDSKDSAVLFCYNLALYVTASYSRDVPITGGAQLLDQGSTVLKLHGLDAGKNYRIKIAGDEKDEGELYTGDYLMHVGIKWPIKAPFDSRILTLTKAD